MQGAGAGGVVRTDAARHALNGALILDWARGGHLADPLGYAARYYAYWPALSIPYHPPLFPALESVVYLAFGVDGWSARLAVALATALSVALLWRLVRATQHSHVVAFASIVTFFTMPASGRCAQDVMLEFPALALVLGALLVVPLTDAGWTWRRSLGFGLIASAAVWTKQQTLFLALVPFTFALLTRRWSWWASPRCWVAVAAPAAAYVGLEALAQASGGEPLKRLASFDALSATIVVNLAMYVQALGASLGVALIAFGIGVAGYGLWDARSRRDDRRTDALLWAWLLAGLLIILPGRWATTRYLFFVLPPIAVIASVGVFRFSSRLVPSTTAAGLLVVLAVGHAGARLNPSPEVLRGPTEVADLLAPETRRVLYCGYTDGHFIFALRAAAGRPDAGHLVIRCDKLPHRVLSRDGLGPFVREYGVSHVVLERTDRPQPWDALWDDVPSGLVLQREVALEGVTTGALRVYRFDTPSSDPRDRLVIRTAKTGTTTKHIEIDWSRRP